MRKFYSYNYLIFIGLLNVFIYCSFNSNGQPARLLYDNANQIFDMDKQFEWQNKELHEIQPQFLKF